MRLDRTSTKTQVLLALLTLTMACSMNRPVELWENDVLRAQALIDRGDPDGFTILESAMMSPPDTQRERWVKRVVADVELKRGNQTEAAELYSELASSLYIDEHGANATHRRALMAKQDGDSKTWLKLLFLTILKYPNEIAAERALEDLKKLYLGNHSYRAWDEALGFLYERVQSSMLGDNLLFERAKNARDNVHDLDQAMVHFARIWADHRHEALADDAIWEIALIQVGVQNWEAAIHNLTILAESGETSWFIGTYNSQWVDDSMLALGEVYVHLGDYSKAYYWFDRFANEYDDSLRAPYALWLAAECRRLLRQDEQHFSVLKRLVRLYPESRWAKRARPRLGPSPESK